MAGSVNKWLSIAVLGYILGIGFGGEPIVPETSVAGRHPLHVTTVEISHNAAEKTLEISCHVFTDDFETVLSRISGTRANLSTGKPGAQMDTLISRYIRGRFLLRADEKPLVMEYVGSEREDQATYSYFQVEGVAAFKVLDVTDALLHDLYDDQIGIIHVIVDGNRKSTKIDYPVAKAHFAF